MVTRLPADPDLDLPDLGRRSLEAERGRPEVLDIFLEELVAALSWDVGHSLELDLVLVLPLFDIEDRKTRAKSQSLF